nr:MAG TPA: hypothetical protein [Caudoviricetes sp.]
MENIELYGIKIKELCEILKNETVKKFRVEEKTNYVNYLIISFELNFEKKIEINIQLEEMENYQTRHLSTENIIHQFDGEFKKLREYLESKNNGKIKKLMDQISKCEDTLEELKQQLNKINNYGENL